MKHRSNGGIAFAPAVTARKVVACLFILFLSACAVTDKTTRTMEIHGAGVIQKPVIADLDIQQKKVTGTASGLSKRQLEAIKQLALADALKQSGADVLIEPTFEVVQTAGKITVTVTGFPATYKNLHMAEITDAEVLKQSSENQHSRTSKPVAQKTLTIGGIALGALLVLSMILK